MERGNERRIRADHRETVRDILARLNASAAPDDMDLPGFRLHPLNGEHASYLVHEIADTPPPWNCSASACRSP